MRVWIAAALVWAGAATAQPMLPADAERLSNMQDIGRTIAWATRCHFPEKAITLVLDRAFGNALRFLSAGLETRASLAVDTGIRAGQADIFPGNNLPCPSVARDLATLAVRNGITNEELAAAMNLKR